MSKPKIKELEYFTRRLSGVKKRRVRKKIASKITVLYTDYCYKHWGISGLFYAHYCGGELDYMKDPIYKKNPFLAAVPKNDGWSGKYIPVPIGITNES